MKQWTRTAATVLAASILCGSVPFPSVSASEMTALKTESNLFRNYLAADVAPEAKFTANDYSAERSTVKKHVEFKINTAEITADELEAMGYTISEDRTVASKDATLAKITYTFNKLPETLEELKEFSMKSDVQGDYDYGMFAPMAATIIALHTFGTNKEEAYKMLEYAYGPNQTFSNIDKQFVQTQFYTAANKALQDCYFGGAAPENGYTPTKPITITLEEGPYVLKSKNGVPERHMSFIYFAGADTERYMDVCQSDDGTWYAYEGNYKHLLASVKEPINELPDEPVEDVPDSEKYYTEKHDTVDKHVEFEINTAEISADELEAMGYTISEDRKTASKDVTLAKITYTFDKLPTTLDELKKFSLKSKVEGDYDYGMFAPMAATIIALHTYGTDKEEAYKMLDYVYGPNQTFSNFDKQFVQTQFATAANKVLQDCYFGGAAPENGYTPSEPITITLEEGPYFIKASNGKPERHMSLIYFDGADTERYMDVFKSSGGTWYAYESNYKHLLASVKKPTGTAPVTTTLITTTTTNATTTTAKATTTTTNATTTTAKATTTTSESTTTTSSSPVNISYTLGDVNGDKIIDGRDATDILTDYAKTSTGQDSKYNEEQKTAADVNKDNIIDGRDATAILSYYVKTSVGEKITLEEYIDSLKNV